MAGEKDGRTERPTSRRLQKAREKGQIARSKEVPAAAILLGMVVILSYCGQGLLNVLESCPYDFASERRGELRRLSSL